MNFYPINKTINFMNERAALAAVISVSRLHTEDTSIWQTDQREDYLIMVKK